MKPFDNPIFVTRPFLPPLKEMYLELEEIWSSKQLTNNGPKLRRLEEEIRLYLGVPDTALFNNGTIALMVAVSSLRIMGEVITTPFTFAATPHVLSWHGISPVFCDIDEKSMTIDASKIEQQITPRTTAILAVHVYGNPCDVVKIQQIADRYGLKVIYDAAHAFNTAIDGVGIGNFGDISMFSFHATKLFHTAEGGAPTCKDANLKQRISLLRNFGITSEEEVSTVGINGKMNEIRAALGSINLRYIQSEREKRRKVDEAYHRCLMDVDGIMLNKLPENVTNSYQYYVIRVDEQQFGVSRDEVYQRLKDYNVFSRKYFYPLCSDYAYYKLLPSANPGNLPVAKKISKQVLCLPLYGELEISSVEKICEIIRGFKTI